MKIVSKTVFVIATFIGGLALSAYGIVSAAPAVGMTDAVRQWTSGRPGKLVGAATEVPELTESADASRSSTAMEAPEVERSTTRGSLQPQSTDASQIFESDDEQEQNAQETIKGDGSGVAEDGVGGRASVGPYVAARVASAWTG